MNKINDITRETSVNNIERIVQSLGYNRINYIYIDDKFITQQVLIYSNDKLVTFYVRKIKNNLLKEYCFQPKYISFKNSLLDLLVRRIIKEEYDIKSLEDIALIDNDSQLYFMNDSGAHFFKIAKNDIYGFDQTEQIMRFKEYVNKVYERIKK